MSRYQPYPEYKDSGVEWIGEVPAHWEVKKLSYLCRCYDGSRVPLNALERDSRKGSVPYWGASKIIDYVDESLFDEELILLGEDGAPFFDGNKHVAFHSNGPIWPNNHVHVLKPTATSDAPFLVHVLNTTDYTFFVDGATRDKLTQSSMMQIPIQYPPDQERERIVLHVTRETTRIDTLVEKKQRFIELLEEKRQAVITQAVTKGLDPNVPMRDSGVEWTGEVPAHWEVKRLSYLCRCYDGSRVPLNALERDSRKGSVPYWGASKIIDYVDESLFDEELILLGEDGAPFFDGNKHVAFHSNGPIWPNNHVHVLKPTATSDAPFLVHVLNTTDYTFFVDGATRDKLTQSSMMQIPIQYPPDQERERIVLHVTRETTRIDTLIKKTRDSIELLKERRAALITAAVTGKIDVREEAAA